MFAAFPDFHITLEDIFATGDKVAFRYTVTGTDRSEFMGAPPTGKQVMFTRIMISRFAEGKIVEDWECWDTLGFMQQLGLVSPPGEGKG